MDATLEVSEQSKIDNLKSISDKIKLLKELSDEWPLRNLCIKILKFLCEVGGAYYIDEKNIFNHTSLTNEQFFHIISYLEQKDLVVIFIKQLDYFTAFNVLCLKFTSIKDLSVEEISSRLCKPKSPNKIIRERPRKIIPQANNKKRNIILGLRHQKMTFRAIGEIIGLSVTRVSQIYRKSLRYRNREIVDDMKRLGNFIEFAPIDWQPSLEALPPLSTPLPKLGKSR
jgi:hypothetical protein